MVNNNNVRMIVRAVKEKRPKYVEYLKKQLPEVEFAFDEKRDIYHTFCKALEMAGNDPCLHMEEDIVLTKGFIEKINKIIADKPDSVIQFFSMRGKDLTVGSRWENGSNFIALLCTYFPSGMSKGILKYHDTWDKSFYTAGIDNMVAGYLKDNKLKYWIHVPSLVQHRVGESLFKGRSKYRISKSFDMDLEYKSENG